MSQLNGLYPEGAGSKIPDGIPKELLLPPYQDVTNLVDGDFALPRGLQAFPMHNGAEYLNNCPNTDELSALMFAHYGKQYA